MQYLARGTAHRTSLVAGLICVGAILGVVEGLAMPSLAVPGMRLGLGNAAVVLAIALVGRVDALWVALGKVVIVGLATGYLFGPVGAMAALSAVGAWSVMALVSKWGSTTPVGWSVAGACAHVIFQFAVAVALVGSPAVLVLLPISLGASLIAGFTIGALTRALIARLSRANVGAIMAGGGGSRDTATSRSVCRGSSAIVVIGPAGGGD